MTIVSVRGGFSDRNNIKPENTTVQLDSFDRRTRVQLQNMISQLFKIMYADLNYCDREVFIQLLCRFVLGDVFSEPVDTRKRYSEDLIIDMINSVISDNPYDDVLTLIEALVRYWDSMTIEIYHRCFNSLLNKKNYLFEHVNAVFKREYVGYRFIDKYITPISDDIEIETIQESLCSKYDAVREHLSKANRFLSDRKKPDYENSIKESISAVEALCAVATNARGAEATLGKMLSKLESSGVVIHPAMKSAFNCLYGYTSDAKGIRHAGNIGGPEATFEEAKYMLVSCCAFVNYITALFAD